MPKFLCAVYLEQDKLRAVSDTECLAFGAELKNQGRLLSAESLQPAKDGKTVRVRNGKATILDGPYAESKELLAGFYLIEAETLDAALRTAAQIPPARVGTIEVRQTRALDAPAVPDNATR